MSMLDGVLSQMAGNSTVAALAAKVGLTPQQVEMALAALGNAHRQPGDTVTQAARQTGLPQDKLSQIVGHLGGEGSLGAIGAMLENQGGGLMGTLGKFI